MKSLFAIFNLTIFAVLLTFCLGTFYSYFYPMTYKEDIITLGNTYSVKSALIASVANVESNFKEDAKSNKGAVGVMQLMPSTAEWLAGKIGVEYSDEMLLDGRYSLTLGSYYLAYLINHFGDEKVGICAYNAGQGKVSAWLKNNEYSSDGKTLKKIPYNETKNYLNKVYKNYNYYKNRYK